MTKRFGVIGYWALFSIVQACGGAESGAQSAEPVTTSGSELPQPALAEDTSSQEPAEEASGPATFTVRTTVAGAAVGAHVRVLDAAGALMTEGDAGSSLQVPSGDHRISVQVTDASALLDQPTQTHEISLSPGNNPDVVLQFPWAKVTLNVMVNGKSENNATVKLQRKGGVPFELKSGAAFTRVSPGRYDADVLVKGSTIKVSGLLIPEGATQTVPVAVQL